MSSAYDASKPEARTAEGWLDMVDEAEELAAALEAFAEDAPTSLRGELIALAAEARAQADAGLAAAKVRARVQ